MRSVKPLSLFVTGQFDSDSERYWPLIPTTRQTVASFRRILWPAWLGFRGQLPSDSVASFHRILQVGVGNGRQLFAIKCPHVSNQVS